MIILICPESKEIRIEEVYKHHTKSGIVRCKSFEEAMALLVKNCCLDPIVTFAPTANVLDNLTSKFQAANGRALVVIYGETEDQAVSTQSYLVEAFRKLIGSAKDGAN